MLEIRPTCEHCNKSLPYDSSEAMICSFECTFCANCALEILKGFCPNCGGGFRKRPVRPEHLLEKHPTSTVIVHKPADVEAHLKKLIH